MTGLLQEYMFKEKLRNCEPIDLSRFVVDLRERHLEFWAPYSDGPREHNSKNTHFQHTDGVHCPPKKPWLLVLPTAFPSTYS